MKGPWLTYYLSMSKELMKQLTATSHLMLEFEQFYSSILKPFSQTNATTKKILAQLKYHSKCVGAQLDRHLHKTISWHYWDGKICGEIPAQVKGKKNRITK